MKRPPNKITDAAERMFADEPENFDPGLDDGPEFIHEEYTDEDVIEAVRKTDERTRAEINATRRRGQAPARGHGGHVESQAAESRARNSARDNAAVWQPADALYAPPPRAGMEQRWIRIRLGEKDDPSNIAKKLSAREGWQPRRLEAVGENYNVPSFTYGRLGTVIGVSDLILCERPIAFGLARAKYYRDRLARQMASADKRHLKKVEVDDHPFLGGATEDMAPTVGRGTRRRPVADE